ncbi:MAG: DNA gyrase subunit A [Candidatus Thermoplasmatota archaeon]|nr:DNA gyrase subunit A [Euryarchaeota archaeon]MBU4032300.1 DNA gyrase subunit A [Candidatus Thermoplasmatota archaeon]MBU4070859.1 DNA gyrase subunit A [Candidatus Thermoplasmatota archaeon]MBU4145088.1 DNA gyrase subunit A [Candidatus Thermoplasmatota archaeon]MBU4592069.1 DNA gyrase subunit A [Candidatus Thermoplasmatota archaeon]
MTEPEINEDTHGQKVVPKPIEHEMKKCYIDYAMSVIVSRALPDVRDGLKPVHRRILHGMNELGVGYNRPYKKSVRVVGDVLGKYHPHGDQALYGALVRMAQTFSLRYTLVDGQGNFGSVDGDSAAAMRYTECRMMRTAEEMLADIDKDTVQFVDNFDGSFKEPTVLPSKLPNLLINGTAGIAVGMATNMPPHNLGEITDGLAHLIDHPDAEISDLMEFVTAPDFPTGGTIYGIAGINEAYNTGRGRIRVRAKTHIEEHNGRTRIIVTEIPYQVNKSKLIENIAELVKSKKIEGITDLRDESDRNGMRIVIELKKGVMEEIVLNLLYKHTQMQDTFGIINLVLVNNEPKVLNLKELMEYFILHRKEIVTRRTTYDLNKAKARAHILEGLLIALDKIDEVIALIRKSKSSEEAREELSATFILSEEQSKAILEMRLSKLTNMERQGVKDEYSMLINTISDLVDILSKPERILMIIKDELLELRNRYADARRTDIVVNADDMDIEDLIPEEDVVITITYTGYVKRLPLDTYKAQRRGGVGLIGMETKEEDVVTKLFVTSTHDYIMFFTNKGRVYWLKAYRIPVSGRHAKGKAIINLLPRLEDGEQVTTAFPIRTFDDDHWLMFATKNGIIKKTKLSAYSNPRVTGIWAVKLRDNDELVRVALTDGQKQVIIASANGQAVRFNETDVRSVSRHSIGVKGMTLRKGDSVVSMEIVTDEEDSLLTITENGYGKRTRVGDYRKTKRGAKGVMTIRTNERNGKVVMVRHVSDEHELIVTSESGMVIRMPVSDIREIGRATQGVRIMRIKGDDKIVTVSRILKSEEEEEVLEAAEHEVGAGASTEKKKISDADFAGLKEETNGDSE